MAEKQPRLRVFMRSHGAENRKNRPDFYDKTSCLASLIRAAENASPLSEMVFINDGPLPAERERLMASAGEVLQGEYGSNRKSYRTTLSIAAARDYDDSDLIWFAEDDYLYTPDSFSFMLQAATEVPDPDYFALFIGSPREELVQTPYDEPPKWLPALSTTSSFAVGRRQLREDLALLRLMPYTGGAFDHTTSLTLQRRYPFSREELAADLLPFADNPSGHWPRMVTRGAVRLVLGTRSLRRASRRRTLYGPSRDLIAHLEEDAFEQYDFWESLADESRAWAAHRLSGGAADADAEVRAG